MANIETDILRVNGLYRDVLTDPDGNVVWDGGTRKNLIVLGFRVLIACFVRGTPAALGVQSLRVGTGLAAWDVLPDPPVVTQSALVDPNPYIVPGADLQFAWVDSVNGVVVPGPTNILQIRAILGPGVPSWPDAAHPTSTLREFALFGELAGNAWMLNSVRHPAIVKDPVSTLTRTLWLVF
jgi:hypothetical protein